MFKDNLNLIFKFLHCTNSSIAKLIGCSPSHISHLRTGNRSIRPGSDLITSLASAFYSYADTHGLLTSFCNFCNINPLSSDDAIILSLSDWLNNSAKSEPMIKEPDSQNVLFSKHFNELMNLFSVSNTQLSRSIGIDPSIITRIRSAVATPKQGGVTIQSIVSFFSNECKRQKKTHELSVLLNLSEDISSDNNYLENAIEEFLFDNPILTPQNTFSDILALLDDFNISNIISSSLSDNAASLEIPDTSESVYLNSEGLRNAILRFLSNAAKEGNHELFLYSDDILEWLYEDETFRKKWYSLLYSCVSNQVRIIIIHPYNGNISGLRSSINNWLPYYLTGNVTPYIYKCKMDSHFSHFFFLDKSNACIHSYHMCSSHSNAVYHYTAKEDSKLLDNYYLQFEELLSRSEKMLSIYTSENRDSFHQFRKSFRLNMDMLFMLTGFSLATLPRKILIQMLSENNISKEKSDSILSRHEFCENTLNSVTANLFDYTEIIPMPSYDTEEPPKLNLSLSLEKYNITYTKREYAEHIRHILNLLETNNNYHVYLLPKVRFTNVLISLSEDNITLLRNDYVNTAFSISNEICVHSVRDYFNYVLTKYYKSREEVKNILFRFLTNEF